MVYVCSATKGRSDSYLQLAVNAELPALALLTNSSIEGYFVQRGEYEGIDSDPRLTPGRHSALCLLTAVEHLVDGAEIG